MSLMKKSISILQSPASQPLTVWNVTNVLVTFYGGVQVSGKVYEFTSEGENVPGSCEYSAKFSDGLDIEDISASVDGPNGFLWSSYGKNGQLAVIDP